MTERESAHPSSQPPEQLEQTRSGGDGEDQTPRADSQPTGSGTSTRKNSTNTEEQNLKDAQVTYNNSCLSQT